DQQISKFYSPLPPTTDNQLKEKNQLARFAIDDAHKKNISIIALTATRETQCAICGPLFVAWSLGQQLLSDNCKTKSKSSITPQPNSTTLSTLKNGHLISKDESTTPITIPALVEAPRKKLDSSSSPFTTSTASTISENGTATQQLSTAVSVGSTSSEPSDTKLK
ncbi:16123_t:CDS:2, partial [Entrophospora sp. SA101]